MWNWVPGVICALAAGFFAYISQRSSSKASIINTDTSGRLAQETDAYTRARKFDVDTIDRQDREIEEQNEKIRKQDERMHEQDLQIEAQKRKIQRQDDEIFTCKKKIHDLEIELAQMHAELNHSQ